MTQSPPLGAKSADPVRIAAQELIDLEDMRLRLRDLHERGHGTDYDAYHARVARALPALRTALAAPEGPAPTRTTERHIALREGHFNAVEDAYWAPRPVEDGVMQRRAFEQGFIRGFDAAEKAYPEAPRQPLRWVDAEIWDDIEKALNSAIEGHYSPDLDEIDSAVLLELVVHYRAALAAPAGAIQPPLDHQVGAK